MCIDCRSCDKQTVEHRDQRPLPRIDDLSDHLHGTVLRYLVLKYSVAFICSLHIKSKPAILASTGAVTSRFLECQESYLHALHLCSSQG